MKDNTTPATKEDIQTLSRSTAEGFQEANRRFNKVHEDIDRVLQILINIEEFVKPSLKDHEKRITRLERHVGVVR